MKKYIAYRSLITSTPPKKVVDKAPSGALSLNEAIMNPSTTSFIGPFRFVKEDLVQCSAKCEMVFYTPSGSSITALFFKKFHESKLVGKAQRTFIRGRLLEKGKKIVILEVY